MATQNLIGIKIQKINSAVYAFNREFPGIIMPITELIEAQRDTKILDLAIARLLPGSIKKNKIFQDTKPFPGRKKASSRQLELAGLEVEENEKVLKN